MNKVNNKKISVPQWLWGAIGGAGVVIVALICFLAFKEKPRYVTPDWDHDTYESDYDDSYGYPGLYPQASTRLLTPEDLYGMSKWDLRVMRNEILARYGYIFKTAEMRNYFSSQSWYEPRYTEVNYMLTSLEWENIKLIKRYE